MQKVIFYIAALLLLCGTAHAQTIILKCVDAKGHVTFTNEGCRPGEHLKDVKAYQQTHDDPVARQRLRDIEQQQDARNRWEREQRSSPVFYSAAPPSERDKKRARCAAARQAANDARSRGLSNAEIRVYDKAAVDACFGL